VSKLTQGRQAFCALFILRLFSGCMCNQWCTVISGVLYVSSCNQWCTVNWDQCSSVMWLFFMIYMQWYDIHAVVFLLISYVNWELIIFVLAFSILTWECSRLTLWSVGMFWHFDQCLLSVFQVDSLRLTWELYDQATLSIWFSSVILHEWSAYCYSSFDQSVIPGMLICYWEMLSDHRHKTYRNVISLYVLTENATGHTGMLMSWWCILSLM
jgi:hypothetical protein